VEPDRRGTGRHRCRPAAHGRGARNVVRLLGAGEEDGRRRGVRPADDFLRQHRKTVVDKIAYWTGVQRPLARKLIEVIEKRSAELGLLADTKREAEHLTEITVYASALATNYMTRGKFIQP